MKILKRILLVIGILLLLFVVIGFFLPAKVHVERSIIMKAPLQVAYDQVNVLRNWEKWNPWGKKDSNIQITYEGPAFGKDAKYYWKSENKQVGNGSLTITDNKMDSFVNCAMEFTGRGNGKASFTFAKTAEGTKVTWGMDSDNGMNITARYFGLAMDKMVGPDFESGLASIKAVSEKISTSTYNVEETTARDIHALALNYKCNMHEISADCADAYTKIGALIKSKNLKTAGPEFVIFNSFSPEEVDMEPGLPVDKTIASAGDVKAIEMKGGNVLRVIFTGPYAQTKYVYETIHQYAKDHNKEISGPSWEVYVSNPQNEKDSTRYITEVYIPIK